MRIKFSAQVFHTGVSAYLQRGERLRETRYVLILFQILNFNQTVDLPIKKLFSLSGGKIISV